MWHNCSRCHTHYTSEEPHLKAYLCDECWGAIPHFTVKTTKKIPKKKDDINMKTIILYTIGNLLCLGVIAYYMWFK
jgi:PHP family Zn ribbon phosphoesterase